jgi:hypothetical protein
MATELEIHEKERFTSYESYYGVDIDFDHENKEYVSNVWSEEYQGNVEIRERYLNSVKTQINAILVKNFFDSLTEIKEHFNHTPDFNNPQQNLENLRVSAGKRVAGLLEDIL